MPETKPNVIIGRLNEKVIVHTAQSQVVQVIKSVVARRPGPTPPNLRPGYDGYELPAGAPGYLDFKKTSTVLMDLSEDEFRRHIVETASQLDDLGCNHGKGPTTTDDHGKRTNLRAEAYLDAVTWDKAYRDTFRDNNSEKTSSCGMLVRNILWLCGARGTPLMDGNYKGGILTHLDEFVPAAAHPFSNKTFLPKIGDVIHLEKTGCRHIFTIVEIDKDIAIENGRSIVRNKEDGSLADEVTFTTIDGGQYDGVGPDSHNASKKWGCNATAKTRKKLVLKTKGAWPNLGQSWPLGRLDIPIYRWISTWEARKMFTAPLIQPIRDRGTSNASGTADNTDIVSRRGKWDDFIESNQGNSMEDLLDLLASTGYDEVKAMRDWYASPENPRKELFGLRPRIAMDAILHENEGDGAGWILADCERAKISPTHCQDQYELIRSTIGIHASPDLIA